MPSVAWRLIALVPLFLPCAGCAGNALALRGNMERMRQEQLAVARQAEILNSRTAALDGDNQQLSAQLAQERQRSKLLEEQLVAVRDELASTTSQIAQLRDEKSESDKKVQALNASLHRRGGATITPNNSLLADLPQFANPNIRIRRDGDVIRVELPASLLFEPGQSQLLPGAAETIRKTALDLLRVYPHQLLGIEGHTSPGAPPAGRGRNHHELSAVWALVVQDVLVQQAGVRPEQLFVVGHGANHPVVSNATEAGQERNRRIEVVVYPERVGG